MMKCTYPIVFDAFLKLSLTMPIPSSTLNHFEYKLKVAFKLFYIICNYVVQRRDGFSVIAIWVMSQFFWPHCTLEMRRRPGHCSKISSDIFTAQKRIFIDQVEAGVIKERKSSHKPFYCIMYQNIISSDGLMFCMYGMEVGRCHDLELYRERGLDPSVQPVVIVYGKQYCL